MAGVNVGDAAEASESTATGPEVCLQKASSPVPNPVTGSPSTGSALAVPFNVTSAPATAGASGPASAVGGRFPGVSTITVSASVSTSPAASLTTSRNS